MISNENSPVVPSRQSIQHFFPVNKSPLQISHNFQNMFSNKPPPTPPRQSAITPCKNKSTPPQLPPKPGFMKSNQNSTNKNPTISRSEAVFSKLEMTQVWCEKYKRNFSRKFKTDSESILLNTSLEKPSLCSESTSSASVPESVDSPPKKSNKIEGKKKNHLRLDLKDLSNKRTTSFESDDDSRDFVEMGAPPTPNTMSRNLQTLENLTPTEVDELPDSMCYPERNLKSMK